MSEAEATSTRDDAELKAMLAMVRYLEPLDRAACSRVLSWAQKRYTELHIADGDLNAFSRFVDGVTEAANTIGNVTPRDIIRFVDSVNEAKAESEV